MADTLNEGRIIKGISGFYYVKAGEQIIECKARGIFRNRGLVPYAGDKVRFDLSQKIIEEILPRKNYFVRPPIANVDNFIIVLSTIMPRPDYYLIDKLTVTAESQGIHPIIVFTKADRASADEFIKVYKHVGYRVFDCSFGTDAGISGLEKEMAGNFNVLVGNSGAGKSSLLNRLAGLSLATQEVSESLGRGKHTTREVTLYDYNGGYLADTPGFSSFDVNTEKPILSGNIAGLFPEFEPFAGGCRFNDCSHTCEIGCRVLEAAADGKIEPTRMQSYKQLVEEAQKIKKWD